ncbi:unnamed protein product [Acanthoscelides obtectus]|uniref:DDE-1 domain-containing protein n=1 Tax=Acanthoscelides obtectus TaxID=200917 RepID=A0A9P0QI08_ACAOB|nr:unnamed protein product [Acanthoscelides obtectus]CAK1683877.1 hypothetical protein AOBTE_LOCUS34498 [Acanthoscelides obtectus]
MLHGTPAGSKGGASPSGWMNSQLFLPVLQHFVQNERPSKEHPKLIILDNHESHLGIAALNFAKQNGILLLTLPPHCSHKLQPLDLAVFGPFKKYYGASCDRWMTLQSREHRGRSKTSRRKSTKKNQRTNKKKEAVKRRILEDSSSDDDSVIYEESSDSLEEFDAYDDSPQAVTKGDFVIVKVYGQINKFQTLCW